MHFHHCFFLALSGLISLTWGHEGSHDHGEELGFDKDLLDKIDDNLKNMAENILKKREFIRNRQHIKEHMQGAASMDIDNASDSELDFNFFKLHDTDNDNRLDGLELLSSMSHAMHYQFTKLLHRGLSQADLRNKVKVTTEYLSKRVDKVLEEEDLNKDGYLSYTEFAAARKAMGFLKEADHFSKLSQERP